MIAITPELALQWQRAGQPEWGWWITLSDEQREMFAVAGDELFSVRFGALAAANTPAAIMPTQEQIRELVAKIEAPAPASVPAESKMIAPPEFNGELSEADEARLDALLADAADSLQHRMEAARNGRN